MQAKLTLHLEQGLSQRAEHHAELSGRSVSQLVADYFSLLRQKKAR